MRPTTPDLTAILLTAVGALALLAGPSPAVAALRAAAAREDPCTVAFPNQREETKRIRFGTENVYNEDLGRALVCSGSFGAPDGVHLSAAAGCDFAAAVYDLADPARSFIGTTDCAAVSAATNGPVSAATGALCGYLADVLGTGVGIFAAGVTANPGIGVAVWRGVTFFGNTAVCVGLNDGTAYSLGVKYETNHEVAVAADVVQRHECLRLTQQRVFGVTRTNWSAITCPHEFATHDADPFRSTAAPQPIVVTLGGNVGSLRLGASTEAQVVAALGAPEATGSGGFGAPETPDYDGLGYECSPVDLRTLRPAGAEGPPYCHTVYYIDSANGVLGGLWTTSTRYETAYGTRVGMSQHTAAATEHKPATVGCESGITETSSSTILYLRVLGGRIAKPPRPRTESYRLVGGKVTELMVEARRGAPVGLLFC